MKILIVDNDGAIRWLLLTTLGDKQEVSTLCSVHDAIFLLSRAGKYFDWVIINQDMPIDDIRALTSVLDISPQETRFVLTGNKVLQLKGRVASFPKPFSIRNLVATIEGRVLTPIAGNEY